MGQANMQPGLQSGLQSGVQPSVQQGYQTLPNLQTQNQPPLVYYPSNDYSYFYYNKQAPFYPNSYYGIYPSPLSLTSLTSLSLYYEPASQPIDYLSLVLYTVLPLLKRKRRSHALTLSSVNGLEIFPCEVCGKVFHKQYNLRLHMKTHLDEKPFLCSKCPKRFARLHDKKRHELLHEGVKNFKCQGYLKDGTKWGCSKQFARSDALARHFRTEAGWLCIKPLMDEAKRLETGPAQLQSQQFQQIAQQSQVYEQYELPAFLPTEDDIDARRVVSSARI